ncbi:MAG: DmsC/YnfH family molybdoenzyme membrane anchor subunit [Planctomycetaceae bacterium]
MMSAAFPEAAATSDRRAGGDSPPVDRMSFDDEPTEGLTPPARQVFDGQTLLARLLSDQQQLTAVEQFARHHDAGEQPAQSRYYQSLIPASPPGPGQQFAFEVDLDRCSGCKACVVACHSLNGLDQNETWRDVGMLIGGTTELPVLQHVTTACHHCIEPGCMNACPVDAYEKDPITGIVKHLDDQCFGCQYCILACPYEVPKYHSGLGIVRKCDMCSDRLAHGEAPACVQACPHEAIAIRIVSISQVVEDSEANVFLPGAPDPQITLPTTTYKSSNVFPRNLLPVDFHSVSAQHPHWPLIVMLVLTQFSVGSFLVGLVLELLLSAELVAAIRPLHSLSALAFGLLALAASTLHLGRPQYAWRAVIGLRHSWLSREIVVFGAFAGAAILYAIGNWFGFDSFGLGSVVHDAVGWSVGAFGLLGVFCSVMIYSFTQRAFWSFPLTATRFALTTALLGIAATWVTLLALAVINHGPVTQLLIRRGDLVCQGLLLVAVIKLVFDALVFRHLLRKQTTPLKRSALLMAGPLVRWTQARFACGVLGGVLMPVVLGGLIGNVAPSSLSMLVTSAVLFVACLAGELLERYLFFAAVASPRMPGTLRS